MLGPLDPALAQAMLTVDDPELGRKLRSVIIEINVTRHRRSLINRWLPTEAVLAAVVSAVPGSLARVAAAGIVGGTGGSVAALAITRARLGKKLRRLERDCADSGKYDIAAFLVGMQVDLLQGLANSRGRVAMASLRGVEYAAQTNSPTFLVVACETFAPLVENLPRTVQKRFAREVERTSGRLSGIADPMQRFGGRVGLAILADHANAPRRGHLLVQLGADLYAIVEQATADFVDPAAHFRTLLGRTAPEEVGEQFIGRALEEAKAYLSEGFGQILRTEGPDSGDRAIQALILADELPTNFVLESYADAMQKTSDARFGVFRRLLSDPDPNKTAALAAIGIGRGKSSGIDPIGA
jgi:hypothetical protein